MRQRLTEFVSAHGAQVLLFLLVVTLTTLAADPAAARTACDPTAGYTDC